MKKRSSILVLITLLILLPWLKGPIAASRLNYAPPEVSLSGAQIKASPAAADFNGNGYKEIVVGGTDGRLYVIAYNGDTWTVVWARQTALDINAAGPPIQHNDNVILSSPAIGDLDNDGRLEIVVTVGGALHHPDLDARRNGGVLVYGYNSEWDFSITKRATFDPTTGQCQNATGAQGGWPQPCIDQVGAGYPGEGDPDGLWDALQTTPALADLNGDGHLEIIVSGLDRRIHAWHYDGRIVEGWPISQWNGDPLWRGGVSSPAVGDLDNDGLPEVVVGTMSPMANGQQDQNATLWAINGDGTSVPGFPVKTEQHIHSSPALGDITGDGNLEVVVGVGRGITSGRQNIVYAWRSDGSLLPGWPRETHNPMLASPALGDVTGDGQLEVVIGSGDCVALTTDNYLYALHADGSLVSGFPVQPPTPNYGDKSHSMCYSPVLTDFDGDGDVEILNVALGAWGIVVIEPNGSVSDTSSYTTAGALYSAPLVDDLTGDGRLEIVVAGADFFNSDTGGLWIWNADGTTDSERPWPMFHRDYQRTGLFPRVPRLEFPTLTRLFHDVDDPSTTTGGAVNIINIGGPSFDWTLTASDPEIQLSRTSGSGEAYVPFTVNVTQLNQGWNEVGTITAEAIYNDEPLPSSPQTATVHVFVGDVVRSYLPLVTRD
jgi:hypothetical protein